MEKGKEKNTPRRRVPGDKTFPEEEKTEEDNSYQTEAVVDGTSFVSVGVSFSGVNLPSLLFANSLILLYLFRRYIVI